MANEKDTQGTKPLATQKDFAESDIQSVVMQTIDDLERNEFFLGVTLVKLDVRAGGERSRDENTGVVTNWPDKFDATFVFVGGEISEEFTPEAAAQLVEGKRYSIVGRIGSMSEIKTTKYGPKAVSKPCLRISKVIAIRA